MTIGSKQIYNIIRHLVIESTGASRRSLIRILGRCVKNLPGKNVLSRVPLVGRTYHLFNSLLCPHEMIVEVNDSKMYIRPANSSVERKLFQYGNFEQGTTRVFRKIVKRGMKIVDIGAHIGYYTLMAAKLVGTEGKVFAFEPSPDSFYMLKRNVNMNKYNNTTLIMKAVSNSSNLEVLYLDLNSSAHNSLYSQALKHRQVKGSITVDTISLDEYFTNAINIDLIKIDVEGAEEQAIHGMQRLLNEGKINAIIIEFCPFRLKQCQSSPENLLGILHSFRFELFSIGDSGINKITHNQALYSTTTGWENLLCLRKR